MGKQQLQSIDYEFIMSTILENWFQFPVFCFHFLSEKLNC